MTVGDIMMQQRPHDDAQTSLHLGRITHRHTHTQLTDRQTDRKTHLHRSGDESTPFVMKIGTGDDKEDDGPVTCEVWGVGCEV
jgi:hypothetical protein